MGNVLREYTIQFLKKHDRAKKLLSLFLCLSIFVSSGVLWQLKMIAVAADDSELGICYETNHGDSTVVVSKKWEDGSINHTSESSSFALYFNDTLINGEKDDTKTLSASNNWTVIFENMPDGDYRIEEIDTTTNSEEYSVEVLPTFITINPANPSTVIWSLVENNTLEPENVYLLATNQEGENKFFLGAALTDNEVITDFENVSAEYQWEYTADFNLRNLSIEEENCYLGLVFEDESPVWTFVNQEEANFFTFTENGTLSVANMEEDGTLVPVEGADVNVISSEVIENEEQEVRFYVSEIYKCNEIPGDPTGNTYDLVMFGSVVTASEQEDIPTVSVEDEQVVEAVENDVVIDEQETDPTEEVAVVEENETDATTIEVLDEVETVDENNNIASVEETTTTDVEITENNNNEVIAEDEINVIDGNITVEVIWKNDLGVEINPVYDVTIELHQIATCAAYGTSLNQVVATGKISAKDEAQEVVFDSLPLSANINGFDYEYSYYVVETYSDCEYACYLDDSTTVVDMDNAIVPAEDTRITVVNTYEEEVIIPFVLPTEEITSEEIGAPVVQAATDGDHWELETGDLVNGKQYLIVYTGNNNLLTHSTWGTGNNVRPFTGVVSFDSSASFDSYSQYTYTYDSSNNSLRYAQDGMYLGVYQAFPDEKNNEGYVAIYTYLDDPSTLSLTNADASGRRLISQTFNGREYWLRIPPNYNDYQVGINNQSSASNFLFYKFVEAPYVPEVAPGVMGGVDFNKSIDDLGDGQPNPDTKVEGADYYRLYLDVESEVEMSPDKENEAIDLVLVIDQSWSMYNYNIEYNGSTIKRFEALDKILVGGSDNGGFIDTFLSANDGNKIAIVGFDGSRFTDRSKIPATPEAFSEKDTYQSLTTTDYATKKPIYLGYQQNGVDMYYDINTVLADIGKTYTYELDTQIIQGWTSGNGFSSASLSSKIGPTLYSGTNYEAGLMRTLDVLKSSGDNNKKIVIFLSDGVPTCYIDGPTNNHRSGTTLDKDKNGNFLPNVAECVDPSIDAFRDFVNAVKQTDMDVTFNSIAISSDIDEYNSVLSKYIYGEGAKFIQADTDVANLYAALMDMAVYTQSTKPDHVVIEDTLSAYVKLAEASDIQITMTVGDETVVLYDEANKITKDGYGVIKSVTVEPVNVQLDDGSYATQKITAEFVSNYVLVPGAKYSLSYNVQVTEEAYDSYYKNDSGYPNKGEDGTDFADNETSGGEEGFNSNEKATVTYDDGSGVNTDNPDEFPHPVIQLDVGTIKVNKKWIDALTGEELTGDKIPADSIEVQLYQVIEESGSASPTGGGKWVLETGVLKANTPYLIVYDGNNNLVTPSNWDDDYRPYTGIVKSFDPNASEDTYKNYTYIYDPNGRSLTYANGYFLGVKGSMGFWTEEGYEVAVFSYIDTLASLSISAADSQGRRVISQHISITDLDYWIRIPSDYKYQTGINSQENASYFKFYRFEPEVASSVVSTDTKPYGKPVEITSNDEGVWTYTFKNLPKSEIKNGKTYTYTYYVEECASPYEHTIEVVDTRGIVCDAMTNGTVTITNKVYSSFTLPNTGGVGIYNNILCGLLIIGGGLFFGVRTKKKGERRQSSA